MSVNALRFIPFRRTDLTEQCVEQGNYNDLSADQFRRLASLLNSLLHYEFHDLLEQLKETYAPHDPNSDTRELTNVVAMSDHSLVDLLSSVLDKANYERVTESDLQAALEESSLFKIRLQVDFDDFEEVLLFCRGESVREESIKEWFGLRKKTLSFTNYDRVVVYLRFKSTLDHPAPNCVPGTTLLKLFQDVPKADLEMLFPNTRIRMRLMDKLLIGVPAAIGGGVVISTKLGGSLILLASLLGYWLGTRPAPVEIDKTALLALLAGVAALGAHFWKQFNNFKNRKMRFIQTLTQNLYFKNLDNNAGVFYRILDEAEEEESKEALLAYHFLLSADAAVAADQLDIQIENWLRDHCGAVVDFEIDDALQKLQRLGLITGNQQLGYRAVDLGKALAILDQHWDDLFSYANPNKS